MEWRISARPPCGAFALTVVLDLTVAIAVGVPLTTLIFMHRWLSGPLQRARAI
jgi:MFS superfamily sulfate permease-like transporter